MAFHPLGLRGRRVHPLTAVYLGAAEALRPGYPLDDLAPPFLVQVRAVAPLRGQAERDRWRAVRGAFDLGFSTRMLRGARVAVIDDVMTTGATLSECARVLREQGGAAVVDAIVLARQPWNVLLPAPRSSGVHALRVSRADRAGHVGSLI